MADQDDRIEIEIVLADGSVAKTYANIVKGGEDTASKLEGSFSGVGKALAAGLGAYLSFKAVKAFISEVTDTAGDAVNSARESEKLVQNLNVALGVAGRYSESASKTFTDLANKIEDTTDVSDDTVLQLEKLAVTYTKTNAEALKLTETSVDLSKVTGQDVNGTLVQLTGTLSGTAGRLAKLFPDLQNFTAAQLKAGAAIDYFNSRFSGTAAAQVNTFDGRLAQMKNGFDNFLKSIGKLVTSSPSVVASIKAITDLLKTAAANIQSAFSGKDIFKDLIINFSVIAQAGTESARRIGLSFELAFLRAQQAWYAFKVLTTAGFSDAFNAQLMAINEQIDKTKAAFTEDSSISQWFTNLIDKVQMAAPITKEAFAGLGGGVTEVAAKMSDAAISINKAIQSGIVNSITAAVSYIGKSLATGAFSFSEFVKTVLGVIGDMAIQIGSTLLAVGLGIDALKASLATLTGAYAIAAGLALIAVGGALKALSGGGISAPTSGMATNGPGGGYVATDYQSDSTSQLMNAAPEKSSVTVHIQGDVLDSRETGLRIVDLINDAYDTDGAVVRAV